MGVVYRETQWYRNWCKSMRNAIGLKYNQGQPAALNYLMSSILKRGFVAGLAQDTISMYQGTKASFNSRF